MTKIELFWDVGSPYTYLALTQIDALVERTGAELELRPFLLGGVFKSAGNTMPAAVPAKAIYLAEDLRRWRDHYRVQMKMPSEVIFPISTLLPMRVAIAAQRAGKGDAFCHAVFSAYWRDGRDVSQSAELEQVVRAVGLDPKSMIDASSSAEVKDALRANTDEAVARGAFGAPALFVGDALFWGNDRLDFVERHLQGRR